MGPPFGVGPCFRYGVCTRRAPRCRRSAHSLPLSTPFKMCSTMRGGAVAKQIDRGPADDEDPVRVSEALGGLTGAAGGAGLGAMLGPAGIIIGGIAGAVGGWWAGHGVGEATDDFNDETDAHYRRLHSQKHADVSDYDDARSFYHLGRVAARNPDYRGRGFQEVEGDL